MFPVSTSTGREKALGKSGKFLEVFARVSAYTESTRDADNSPRFSTFNNHQRIHESPKDADLVYKGYGYILYPQMQIRSPGH